MYERTLRELGDSEDIDALVAVCVPPAYVKSEPIARAVLEASSGLTEPIVACFMAGDLVADGVKILESGGIPSFPTARRTAKAIWSLVQRGRYLRRKPSQ
jgi:acyl-CoA synthetase (NDP forming)